MIPDVAFEKERNRILALDHPLIDLGRKIERGCLLLRHGNWKGFLSKVSKYVIKGRQKET